MADNTDNSGSIVGGLMGLKDPDLLLNLGLGLMSAGRYGGNVGDGISGALRNYQQQKLGTQQYQMGQLELMRQKMLLGAAQQEFGNQGQPPQGPVGTPGPGAPQGSPAGLFGAVAPAQSPAGPAAPGMPGAVGMPAPGAQGTPPALFGPAPPPQAAPPAGPSWLTSPTQSDIYGAPVPGFPSPRYVRGTALLAGRNPLPELASMRDQQLKNVQQQYAPVIGRMDTLVKSDNPTQYMQADPEFKAAWPVLAQRLGIDPVSGLKDQNVRTAFTFARNNLASSLSEATVAPNVPLQTVPRGVGGSIQINPVDQKITTGAPELETAQFMQPDGSVKLMTKAAGMAKGLTPFNPTIFGAANTTDQAIQFAADTYRATGKFPANMGRNVAMQARVLDKVAADAAAQGDSAGAIAARAGALKANSTALTTNTKLLAATQGYAETLDKNLNNLLQAYSKVDSTGSPLINKALRVWQQGGTGDAQTAAMVTWLNAVQGEYAKLRSGSLGNQSASDASMRDSKEVINKSMNEGGIQAVAAAIRAEKDNRLTALQEENQRLLGAMGQKAAPPVAAPGVRTKTSPNSSGTLSDDALLKKWGGG